MINQFKQDLREKHQKDFTWSGNVTTSIGLSDYRSTIWEIQQVQTTSKNHQGQVQNCVKSGVIKESPLRSKLTVNGCDLCCFLGKLFCLGLQTIKFATFIIFLFFIISKLDVRIRSFNSEHFLVCNVLNFALFGDFSYFSLILCLKWLRIFLGFHKVPSPP